MSVNRRDFLLTGGVVGALAASGVLVPLGFVLSDGGDGEASGASGAVLASFPRTRIATLGGLAAGEPEFFDYPFAGQSNLVVRLGSRSATGVGPDHDIVAYSNICTHMGCPLTTYNAEERLLGPCACHFTTFDLAKDGQVTLGQATQNLPQVLLEVEGDDIFATGLFRLVYGHSDNLEGINVEIAKGL